MRKKESIAFLMILMLLSSSYVFAQPEISGFTAFGFATTPERADFFLGATEIGFVREFKEKFSIEAVGVFEPTGDVGIEPTIMVNNIFKDGNLILGYFDAPFGLEPTYWDPPDNPFNTLSLLQEHVLEEYGDVGMRLNVAKEILDIDLYISNGFGTEMFEDNDKTKSLGTFLNFKPGGIINIGGSFSGNLIKNKNQASLMIAGGHAGILTEKLDFISEYAAKIIDSKIDHQGIYSLVSLKMPSPLFFAIRGGLIYDDKIRTAFFGSGGTGVEISDNIKVKADYKYTDVKDQGLEHSSQIVLVVSF